MAIKSTAREGKNYEPWHMTRLGKDEFKNLSAEAQLWYLCSLASLAPSSHNTQPWRFVLNPNAFTIDVYLDRQYVLEHSDVAGRQATISIGCAVEHIAVGAELFGMRASIHPQVISREAVQPRGKTKKNARHVHITRITLTHAILTSPKEPGLFEAIFTRKMQRSEFDPTREIPKQLLRDLEKAADGKEVRLHFISDIVRKMALAEFQAQADNYVINSPNFSRELGEWLLPNDTEAPLGMPGVGFGLKDSETLRLHDGLMGNQPLQPEDGLKFALGGKVGIEKAPVVVAITVLRDDPEHWLAAGRALERVCLILEKSKVSIAVHAALAEVALIKRMFAVFLGTRRAIAILFRVGYVKNAEDLQRPHSPRRSIDDLILAK